MSRARWITPLLVVLLAGGALAACGDDDSSDTTAGTESKGDDTVNVTMREYAFRVSGPLTAGGSIELENDGNELHMMGIGKLKPGVTIAQVRDALAKADPNAQTDPTADLIEEEIGWPGGIVSPGHSVAASAANLQPGTYGLICFLPTEGGGGPHFSKGMLGELEVTAGSVKTTKPDATYKVTPGQPIDGPATLDAGTRTIEVTGDGDISQQEPQLVKAQSANQSPDQINDFLNQFFGQFEGENGPEKGIGKKLADYIPFTGFDFGPNRSITFTYDFEPGTYYLAAPDTDNQEGPSKVPTELVKITVE